MFPQCPHLSKPVRITPSTILSRSLRKKCCQATCTSVLHWQSKITLRYTYHPSLSISLEHTLEQCQGHRLRCGAPLELHDCVCLRSSSGNRWCWQLGCRAEAQSNASSESGQVSLVVSTAVHTHSIVWYKQLLKAWYTSRLRHMIKGEEKI